MSYHHTVLTHTQCMAAGSLLTVEVAIGSGHGQSVAREDQLASPAGNAPWCAASPPALKCKKALLRGLELGDVNTRLSWAEYPEVLYW